MTEIKDFQKLFYTLYPSLCRQAQKYIANQAVCEDIVQDCFVKYWENYERTADISNPSSYLKTSIKNSCISYLRKEKREDDIEDPKLQILIHSKIDEDEKAEDFDEIEIINQALALLPDKCRQIFEMSKIQNKSYKEIAELLHISVKTIENQMGKALKTMRQFVKDNPQYFPFIFIVLYNFLLK